MPVCVTERVTPVVVLVTVTVSVAVAPLMVRVPLTTRLWPISRPGRIRVAGSTKGLRDSLCSAMIRSRCSRSTTTPSHFSLIGWIRSLMSMSAIPLRRPEASAGPETTKCWTHVAG